MAVRKLSSIYYSAYTVLPEQGFEQIKSGSSLIKTGLVSAILGFSGVYVPQESNELKENNNKKQKKKRTNISSVLLRNICTTETMNAKQIRKRKKRMAGEIFRAFLIPIFILL